jgi:hypothetical protein
MTRKRHRISAEQEQRIVTAYRGGAPVRAIAADELVAFGTVHRVLKRHDVQMRSRGGYHPRLVTFDEANR